MSDIFLTIAGAAPGIAMIAVFALIWGGAVSWKRDRQRALLMIACAIVIFANVLIWTL